MLNRHTRILFAAGLAASLCLTMLGSREAQGGGISTCTSQSPANCSANRLNIDLQASPLVALNGTFVTYMVSVFNNPAANADACDVKAAFVTFCCPAANGLPEPGPTGCTKIPVTSTPCNVNDGANCVPTAEATSGIDFPANGSNDKTVNGLKCLINVNSGVTTARAQAMVDAGYLLCQLPPPSMGVVQPALPKLLDIIVTQVSPTPTNTPTQTNTPTITPTRTPASPTATPTETPFILQPAPTMSPGMLAVVGIALSLAGIVSATRLHRKR